MENYLVDINKLVVNEQTIRYDFLYEMYPVINDLYNKLWFYENLASLRPEVKNMKILELKKYISQLLEAYSVPESVLFVKIQDNKYLEPISRTPFKLNNGIEAEQISESSANIYIDLNRRNSFFQYDIPKFKELTKIKYKKS